MRYFSSIFLALFFISFSSFSQNSWNWQNPIPQGNGLAAIHAVNQNMAYAAGTSGTILKTSDGGSQWEFVHYVGGFSNSLYSVYFVNPDTGWAVGPVDNILKTVNGGLSWQQQNCGSVYTLNSVFFTDDTTGWLAAGPELYKTTDGGDHWDLIVTPSLQIKRSIFFINPLKGWIICAGGDVLRTINGGDSLLHHSFGINYNLKAVYFLDEDHGWIVGSTGLGTPDALILYTIDGGANWTDISPQIKEEYTSVYFSDLNNGCITNGSKILQTTDGGVNWSTSYEGKVYHMSVSESGTGWAVGTYGEIAKSSNFGKNWQRQSHGHGEDLEAVHFINENIGWASGKKLTVQKTYDGGLTWNEIFSQAGQYDELYDIFFVNESVGWVVGNGHKIMKTTNGGYRWQGQINSYNMELSSVYFVNDTTGWVVGRLGELWHTTDGESWTQQNCPNTSWYYSVFFINDSTGWAVGEFGKVIYTNNTY